MKKTLGLGRGLDALIDTTHVATAGSSSINEIAIDKIYANPDQPRPKPSVFFMLIVSLSIL